MMLSSFCKIHCNLYVNCRSGFPNFLLCQHMKSKILRTILFIFQCVIMWVPFVALRKLQNTINKFLWLGRKPTKFLFFSYLLTEGLWRFILMRPWWQWKCNDGQVGTQIVGRWNREQYYRHCLKVFQCRKKIGWRSNLMEILIIVVCLKSVLDTETNWLLMYHPWCLLNIIQCSKLWGIVLIFKLGKGMICIIFSSWGQKRVLFFFKSKSQISQKIGLCAGLEFQYHQVRNLVRQLQFRSNIFWPLTQFELFLKADGQLAKFYTILVALINV